MRKKDINKIRVKVASVKVNMEKYPTIVVEEPVSSNTGPLTEKESDLSSNPKTDLYRRFQLK